MPLEIITLPVAGDNYCYCCIDGGDAAVVDASAAEPVIALLEQRPCTLRMILSTHHHGDHTAGNARIRKETGCSVYGGDKRIAAIDHLVCNGQIVREGSFSFEPISVPGHTRGCIAWYSAADNALFTGDALFYAGCGRLFEGTAAELHRSLQTICRLPSLTKIYCGHEYTLDNLRFACSIEPDNPLIIERTTETGLQLQRLDHSGPSTIALEQATNPFLRTGSPDIRRHLGLMEASDEAVFGELRRRKDYF